ncbi:MAG: hypothetical protein U1F43_11010 [Myxococcota bacterium]
MAGCKDDGADARDGVVADSTSDTGDAPSDTADAPSDTSDAADDEATDGDADVTTTDDADADVSGCAGASPGGTCSEEGAHCDLGQECCCGACHPSLVCSCGAGQWACFYTDACLVPACPDAGDASDTGDAETTGDTSADCSAAESALAATLYPKTGQAFTAVVRLDHDSLAILGYALVVGAYHALDEAGARGVAEAATGYGSGGHFLSGPDAPSDAWVFYEEPGDFGGAAAVSAHTGLAVFGGGIVWDGAGDITWPTAWSPASDLASGCSEAGGPGATRGFDLVNGEALSAEQVAAALAPVRQTALLGAMWSKGYVFDSVVLRYPRTVGAFDPSTAEWIVLVSGGWLE